MFGYVTIAAAGLSRDRQDRYRAMYCGLCHTLGNRFGSVGRMTLSYDATFLYILLSSLYEPPETQQSGRCLPHPLHTHPYVSNEIAGYCCDMNLALAYHKCMDNWQDDHSPLSRAEAALLEKGYRQVAARYPEKCRSIEECLHQLARLEQSGEGTLDAAANTSARLLGIIYRYREDLWADELERMGQCLGRFIYLMDAYDDLPADIRKKRFNPLREYQTREDYESFVKESLTMLIGECTALFEALPLVQDMDILRNILYAGCWTRYEQLHQKRNKGVPAKRADHKEDGA